MSDSGQVKGPSATATGALMGVATAALLAVGIGRSYELDSAVTISKFVATPSISDAFTRSYLFNNHVFFSFLEHLVYSATGSRGDVAMRILPIGFAALAVAIFTAAAARRLGPWPAVAGGALLATNPMFAEIGSQVRGYSLVVLATVVTSVCITRGIEKGELSTGDRVIYALFAAIGLATHLYMFGVLAAQGLVVVSRGRKLAGQLVLPWLVALVGGGLAYVQLLHSLVIVNNVMGHRFRGGFPWDLTVAVLGGSVVTTLILAVLLAPELWDRRKSRTVQAGCVALVLLVAFMWLGTRPYDLYPRFFLWVVLIPALGAALAVARRPRIGIAIGFVIVVQLAILWPHLTEDPLGNRSAAQALHWVSSHHGRGCILDPPTALRIDVYTRPGDFVVPRTGRAVAGCTIVVSLLPAYARTQDTHLGLTKGFRYKLKLAAREPGTLWSQVPPRCWAKPASPAATGACRIR